MYMNSLCGWRVDIFRGQLRRKEVGGICFLISRLFCSLCLLFSTTAGNFLGFLSHCFCS